MMLFFAFAEKFHCSGDAKINVTFPKYMQRIFNERLKLSLPFPGQYSAHTRRSNENLFKWGDTGSGW